VRLPHIVTAAALLPLQLASAQRQVDLTRKPDAVIGEPFTLVAGVRELPGNLAVVTDQMDRILYLANFASRTAVKIGRQGEGPGEYRFPMAPLAGPGNTTWVVDASLRRTLQISAAGTIVSSLGTPTGGLAAGVVEARGSDAGGRLYFEGNSFDAQQGRFSDSVAIVRWNPRDNRTDVVARVWSGGRVTVRRSNGTASYARRVTPYPALDAWAVLPGGEVVVVHHDPFRIDVVDPRGTIHAGTPIAYTPLPVTAADREAYRRTHEFQRSSAAMKDGGAGERMAGPKFLDEEFPSVMPPFVASSVATSPDGEIWIGRSHAGADKTWRYDIFDAKGTLVGFAKLAANATVVGFGQGTVYVARLDPADDLVYLERRRR
jgi:hypothetical protein